jgi:hypothetical protein
VAGSDRNKIGVDINVHTKKANSVDIQCAHKTKPTWQSVTESQTQLALLEVNQDPSRRDPEQHGIKPLATAAQSAT